MSTGRLTFLYPHLFRVVRAARPTSRAAQDGCRQCRAGHAQLSTSVGRRQQLKRHGKAVDPFPPVVEPLEGVTMPLSELRTEPKAVSSIRDGKVERSRVGPSESAAPNTEKRRPVADGKEESSSAPLSDETQAAERGPGDADKPEPLPLPIDPRLAQAAPPKGGPLDEAIKTAAVPMENPDDLHIPHLQPPPYVHNFDTYSLVKQVEKGGFTDEQAITAMKAVRVLLAKNLEVAKEGLVSKSDVENESYLFRAACSELKTEIQNSRRASDEKMRRERTQLQHEYDILNQKLTQELLILKDELTGMFNDRKMAVRMEQREMDSAIQQLHYKITVDLSGDSKSEVEGLRWVLTRRSVLAIVFMALMVLSSLRYASYRAHEQELERKRIEKLRLADEERRKRQREGETQTDPDEVRGLAEGLTAS